MISASIDLSIFDPESCIAADFYVSLHKLVNTLRSNTTLLWSAVDVLQAACRNSAARQALTHTYKFALILTELLIVFFILSILKTKFQSGFALIH